jgi:hypothetical protein
MVATNVRGDLAVEMRTIRLGALPPYKGVADIEAVGVLEEWILPEILFLTILQVLGYIGMGKWARKDSTLRFRHVGNADPFIHQVLYRKVHKRTRFTLVWVMTRFALVHDFRKYEGI